YSGSFFSSSDRKEMARLHTLLPEELAMVRPHFQDKRLPEMLFRYRARNYPQTLNTDDFLLWEKFRASRLNQGDAPWLAWDRFWEALAETRAAYPHKADVLDELKEWAEWLRKPRAC